MEVYPESAAAPELLFAQQAARHSIETLGRGTWDDVERGVERYRYYCDNGGASGPQFVKSMKNFFKGEHWRDAWTPPMTKADQRLAGNIDAAAQAKAELERELGA